MMQCHSLLLLQMLAPYLALLLLGPAAAFSPLSPVISRTPLGRHGSTTSSYHQGGSTSFAFDRTAPLNLFSPFARATKAEKTAQTTATIIQTPTGPMTMPSGASAPVTVITSPQELADFLNQDDRLCVIKFHASWCKSCQKFGLKFKGLAKHRGDWIGTGINYDRQVVREGDVRFASIEIGTNLGMCQHLKVKTLPFVHLYAEGEQLAGFPCGPARFYKLKEQLQYFQDQLEQMKKDKEEIHQQPVSETIQMFQRMMNPKTTPANEVTSLVAAHGASKSTPLATDNEEVDSTVPSESTETSFKVTPSSTPTTFTPELLEEMIALDARGELKTTASKKALDKKRWGVSL